ncbi:hypothetical protein BC332_02964 [Capsicum chinense]|nr:hypothetical protein BC332_02964 [Capsicum chinense]
MLPSIVINIVSKRLGVIDETESVVSKRLGVIDDEMPIVIDDDDKDTAGVSVGVTGRTIMVAGTCYIPKLNKEKPLGQDASFICAKEHTIGVAYGVGGWAKKGIDSGEYSRELMINAEFAIRNNKSSSIDLMKVLNEAYSKTKAKGSSTACIVTLAYDTLHGVNVGDGSFPVIAGDVIVLGTDGLFDNVHDLELETVVNSAADTRKSDVPGTLAWRWRIAQYALDNAKSKELYTRLLENVGELVLYVMVESMMILLSL